MADSGAFVIPSHVPADRVVDFDMYADEGLRTVAHDRYREMLAEYPEFFYTPRNGGHWVAIGKEAVNDAFHAYELFGNFSDGIPHPPERSTEPTFIPIQMDPPEAAKYRGLINPALGPKAIAGLSDEIRELCAELIEKVVDAGECEFVDAISLPLPVLIFMRQMGLPQDRYKELAGWAQNFLNGETIEDRRASFGRIWAYLGGLIQERIANPQDDWISRLAAADLDGERLDPATKVLPMCMLLFVGGLDTVKNSLGHFMRILAGRPDLQARLAADPSLIPDAVEELFRLLGGTSPPRIMRKDGEFRGVPVRKDELVLLITGTVGIDEKNVSCPFDIDFDRDNMPHLAFGAGPHRCAGSNLARAELRIFFEEWFKRIPTFEIGAGTRPNYVPGVVNAIENLSLSWPVG